MTMQKTNTLQVNCNVNNDSYPRVKNSILPVMAPQPTAVLLRKRDNDQPVEPQHGILQQSQQLPTTPVLTEWVKQPAALHICSKHIIHGHTEFLPVVPMTLILRSHIYFLSTEDFDCRNGSCSLCPPRDISNKGRNEPLGDTEKTTSKQQCSRSSLYHHADALYVFFVREICRQLSAYRSKYTQQHLHIKKRRIC